MPPPEFNLEIWRKSVKRLRQHKFNWIAPTHYGLFDDPGWHLSAVEQALDEVEAWMEAHPPTDLPFDRLKDEFVKWTEQRSFFDDVPPELIDVYEAANPSWMSTSGMLRYWQKNRLSEA